jgi:hypothetical protein
MLLPIFGNSQSIKVVDGDSLVLVPVARLRVANVLILEGQACKADNIHLQAIVNDLKLIEYRQGRVIERKNEQIESLYKIVSTKDEVIGISEQLHKAEIKKVKQQRNYSVGAGLILIILVIFT